MMRAGTPAHRAPRSREADETGHQLPSLEPDARIPIMAQTKTPVAQPKS